MQRFIISQSSFADQPCERCGGKKRMGKSWKETVPVFTTKAVVEYSRLVCMNIPCQEAFDKKILAEEAERLLKGLKTPPKIMIPSLKEGAQTKKNTQVKKIITKKSSMSKTKVSKKKSKNEKKKIVKSKKNKK